MADSSLSQSPPARHLEEKRKFEVAGAAVMPSFDGLIPTGRVTRRPVLTLHAVYYDTPGRDLTAHRITVCRRTGGTDDGWHLELPDGPDARTEVRAALGPGDRHEVPADLRDVVLAIVRDRPLVRVAQIVTTRTVDVLCDGAGTALAEFCDDHVAGSTDGEGTEKRWREWELELTEVAVAGGRAGERLLARLSRRLQDAGAVPAEQTSKLARVLGPSVKGRRFEQASDDSLHRAVAEQVDALLVWDRAVRTDIEDSVHQMRVTIRTIRSLLQASASAWGLSDDAEILEELRELAAVLGTARDAEVLADRYQRALDELPSDVVRGPIRERLVDESHRRYRAGLQRSLRAMRSERYFRLLDALDALLARESANVAVDEERVAEATIADGYKRLRRRVEAEVAADDAHHDAALHGIRKSAKRLRYTAAAAGAQGVSDAAKVIQTLLGDHQDSVVSRGCLIERARIAHAGGEDTFTYGLLHQREADLARRCEEQLPAALTVLAKAVAAMR